MHLGADLAHASRPRTHYNAPVTLDASAPTRVDLAGATLDIWPLYLYHADAQTLNVAITLRAHCRLTGRSDRRILIRSLDTGHSI